MPDPVIVTCGMCGQPFAGVPPAVPLCSERLGVEVSELLIHLERNRSTALDVGEALKDSLPSPVAIP
jgi:hypothetical protein